MDLIGSERHEPRRLGLDRGRFARLVDTYLDRVYRFLLAMLGDREMAEDLTQETFARLARARPPLRHASEPWPSAAYIFASARNVAISALRHRRLESRHLVDLPADELAEPTAAAGAPRDGDPSHMLERSELRSALHRALAKVPEPARAVFVLSELEGLSYSQIAAHLDCPAGTIASRKHAAVQILRRELRRQGFGY